MTIDTPRLIAHAGRAAELPIPLHLVIAIAPAVVAAAIIGLTFDGILAGSTAIFIVGANPEVCPAAPVHPETILVNSPGLILNAGRTADLTVQPHLVIPIAAAVVPVPIIGFALNGVLRGRERRKDQQCTN
jgi:hypothetical protein